MTALDRAHHVGVMTYQQGGYPPQQQGYPPQQQGYPPQQQQGYPPQQQPGPYGPPPGSQPYGFPPPPVSRGNAGAAILGLIGTAIVVVSFLFLAEIDFNTYFDRLIDEFAATSSERAEARMMLDSLGIDWEITGLDYAQVIFEVQTLGEVMGDDTGDIFGDTSDPEFEVLDYLVAAIPIVSVLALLASLLAFGANSKAFWAIVALMALAALVHLGWIFTQVEEDFVETVSQPGLEFGTTDFLGIGYYGMGAGSVVILIASLVGMSGPNAPRYGYR